jgi:hypothetical protein
MMAAKNTSKADLSELYAVFGSRKHIDGRDYDDNLIKTTLKSLNLPAELFEAADDPKFDKDLEDSITSATDIVGNDVGVPIIMFIDASGKRRGYFGPVLQALPKDNEACLKLWDGLTALATSDDFYELKRTRPDGGPDTSSTAQPLAC